MNQRRHLLVAGTAWVVLSALAMFLLAGVQILPEIASKEADIENRAFVLLTVVSMPVLMFVVVGLIYSAIRFRAGSQTGDGPPVHGHTGFQAAWVAVSAVLVLGLFAYGAIGLVEIRGAQTAEFEVAVSAEQWAWHFSYPATGVESSELHIPVNKRVHLTIQSTDVIHSFWVPAFGVKQDAVPGRITQIYLTANRTATFPGMCAELCGLGHTGMTMTVVVSDQATLDAWLSQQPQASPS